MLADTALMAITSEQATAKPGNTGPRFTTKSSAHARPIFVISLKKMPRMVIFDATLDAISLRFSYNA